jgi:hypothetical protein
MPAGEESGEHGVDHLLLADQRLADLGAHRRGELRGLGELFGADGSGHRVPLSSAT